MAKPPALHFLLDVNRNRAAQPKPRHICQTLTALPSDSPGRDRRLGVFENAPAVGGSSSRLQLKLVPFDIGNQVGLQEAPRRKPAGHDSHCRPSVDEQVLTQLQHPGGVLGPMWCLEASERLCRCRYTQQQLACVYVHCNLWTYGAGPLQFFFHRRKKSLRCVFELHFVNGSPTVAPAR